MRKKTIFVLFMSLILILVNFTACNNLENTTNSASQLILNIITGNDISGTAGSTTIFSDVLTTSGGIFNDSAEATLTATLLDPGAVGSTFYQAIVVERIYVEFSRIDGNNEQGKNIPYSFSQNVNVTIGIGEAITFPFILVQHTAKMEPPLIDLRYIAEVYKMEAKITFYGKDIAGKQVNPVTGLVSVWFANFADTN
jgi:hypothetical protein